MQGHSEFLGIGKTSAADILGSAAVCKVVSLFYLAKGNAPKSSSYYSRPFLTCWSIQRLIEHCQLNVRCNTSSKWNFRECTFDA